MSTNAIISASSLDIKKVSFGEIRLNKAGGKSVPIKYNGQNLQIRLTEDTYPMGINIKETDNGINYTMSMTLKGCDPFAKDRATAEQGVHGHLYNFLTDLQTELLKTATTNSSKWFGKTRTEGVLAELMKQFISPSVEKLNGEWVPTGKYPPSFRMKVPVYDGNVAMDVVRSDGKPVELTTDNIAQVFPKRVAASLVVAPSVYVSGQGFGVTWRITFARVSPPTRMTAAQVFADEIREDYKAPVADVVSQSVDADEFEEEREEGEEISVPVERSVTPPPAPAPAKTNRRRVQAAVA